MDNTFEINQRIKQIRIESGMSQRELGRRTGLTASFLSQVEHGKVNLSLESLRRVAEALGLSLLQLLPENHPYDPLADETSPRAQPQPEAPPNLEYSPVVRGSLRPQLILPGSGVSYELLTPDLSRKMEAICGILSPGSWNVARRLREPTEEFIYVLSGALLVGLKSGEHTLQAGDSIYFDGADLAKLSCASENEAVRWISVFTPAVF